MAVSKMQIKITPNYHFVSIRLANIENDQKHCYSGMVMWEVIWLHCWWKCELLLPFLEGTLAISVKVENIRTVCFSNSTSGNLSLSTKSTAMNKDVYLSTVYNIKNCKTKSCLLIVQWEIILQDRLLYYHHKEHYVS